MAIKRLVKRKKYSDNRRSRQKIKTKVKPKSRKNETQENGLIRRRNVFRKKDTEGRVGSSLASINNIVDHNFLFDEPSHLTEVENKIIGSNAAVFYVEPNFEYLSPEWERFSIDKTELDLPNLYLETDYISENDRFKDLKINRKSVKNYQNLVTKYLPPSNETRTSEKNILFSKGYKYKQTNYNKKDYPFYIEIAIKNKTNTEFKDKLIELGLFEVFVEDYISSEKSTVTFNDDEQVPAFDMSNWINSSDMSFANDSITVLKEGDEEVNNFTYNLKKLNFSGFMRKQIKKHMRTYDEVLNKKLAYSEELFYRIDKLNHETGELIQSFWLPADRNIQLIDTQVKYGIKYRYTCKVYYLVVGNVISITTNRRSRTLTSSPSVQVLELPYFEDTCRIVQPPQPVPDIEFHNDKYNKNKIKVSIKLNSNDYEKSFIPLEADELSQNDLIEEYNKLKRKNYFQYETEHALFEVFRMLQIPKNYDEIDNFKIAEIRHPYPSIAATFFDKIQLDTPYYYVFRSINYHELLSNPTAIYEIKLTEDADETFLHINVVGFYEEEMFQPTLKFSKLIQIIPSSLHTVIKTELQEALNPSVKNKIDKVQLGLVEPAVWGKRFKFRFTSTDTGKKIDINVNVELTRDKTLEDFK